MELITAEKTHCEVDERQGCVLRILRGARAFLIMFLITGSALAIANEKVLRSFDKSGFNPTTSLVFDAQGNLYGTASIGGPGRSCFDHGCGVVFKMTRKRGSDWGGQVLYTFQGGSDGAQPNALTLDGEGNLYGTVFHGGTNGCGTAFKLEPNSDGTYTFSVIYEFQGGLDGCNPLGSLIFDGAGNLYGTTFAGGSSRGAGTVFELLLGGNGAWSKSTLYQFLGNPGDGGFPTAGLAFDTNGNLYGTTQNGGPGNAGTVFQLLSDGSGEWTEVLLHTFSYSDNGGSTPQALILDANGNIYGVAGSDGATGIQCGAVYKLVSSLSGSWAYHKLHTFGENGDGCLANGPLAMDSHGNLYGTTFWGSTAGSNGLVYELTLGSDGKWKERRLHEFTGTDGSQPTAGVIPDSAGNIYGTTEYGGEYGNGTVFEVRP